MSAAKQPDDDVTLHCPSARPEIPGSFVFGVIGGTPAEPRMIHLAEPVPVTEELLAQAAPVTPTEVFRFAAPCIKQACMHWDGANCSFAQRVVAGMPEVVEALPFCRIRPQCRWWHQEGRNACLRCPLIVTDWYNEPDEYRAVSGPMFVERDEEHGDR